MNITGLKEHVKKEADIVKIVQHFVRLKRSGHEYIGLCPFHSERTPSFTVDPVKRIFKCFGCGIGGDSVEFIMRQEHLCFVEALHRIAQLENIPVSLEDDKKQGYNNNIGALRNIKAVERGVVEKTLAQYQNNPLFWYITGLCGGDQGRALTQLLKYYVGTATGLKTVYWQVDQFQRVRTAQVIAYDTTGHRIKTIPPKRVFTQKQGYSSCFFGEHLLLEADRETLVCVVESEKSAVIADLYLPELQGRRAIWIASCGAQGITDEKMWALKGMRVCLVPDLSFSSRAQWGLLPMRKKVNEKGQRVIAEDGELEADFVSRGAALAKMGCTVTSYDADEERRDNADLADILVEGPAPGPMQSEPDWEDLGLPQMPFE